ncbi:hypothetical protein LGM69_25265 [Burkholderia multivorans]|nr:hypothetical protein [Burkholderia multivorans]
MKGPARDFQKNIRLSAAELDLLNKAAQAVDQPLADFVRCAAIERAKAEAQRDALRDMFERLLHDLGGDLERGLLDRLGTATDVAVADVLAAVEKRSAAVYERVLDRHQVATGNTLAVVRARLDRVDALLTGLTKGLGALAAPVEPTAPVRS